MKRKFTEQMLTRYEKHLVRAEMSALTVSKYLHDIRCFYAFLPIDATADKETVIAYKAELLTAYKIASVNSMLTALNGFFSYLGFAELRVKSLKQQKQIFCAEEKELTRAEYKRLCRAAQSKGNERLNLLMQTVCACGIRVSELRFITVEAARGQRIEVCCKGKTRRIFIQQRLADKLLRFAKARAIAHGSIFITKSGRPLDRSNIWKDMKKLCADAHVSSQKVFPHNLRHLFARTFYSVEHDIVRLADILGHGSIETTRIYTVESGAEHEKRIASLHLLL